MIYTPGTRLQLISYTCLLLKELLPIPSQPVCCFNPLWLCIQMSVCVAQLVVAEFFNFGSLWDSQPALTESFLALVVLEFNCHVFSKVCSGQIYSVQCVSTAPNSSVPFPVNLQVLMQWLPRGVTLLPPATDPIGVCFPKWLLFVAITSGEPSWLISPLVSSKKSCILFPLLGQLSPILTSSWQVRVFKVLELISCYAPFPHAWLGIRQTTFVSMLSVSLPYPLYISRAHYFKNPTGIIQVDWIFLWSDPKLGISKQNLSWRLESGFVNPVWPKIQIFATFGYFRTLVKNLDHFDPQNQDYNDPTSEVDLEIRHDPVYDSLAFCSSTLRVVIVVIV